MKRDGGRKRRGGGEEVESVEKETSRGNFFIAKLA